MSKKSWKTRARSVASQILGREVVLMPPGRRGVVFDTPDPSAILPVRYTYRASDEGLATYQFLRPGQGLRFELWTVRFDKRKPQVGQLGLTCCVPEVAAGDVLKVSLLEPQAWLNDLPLEVNAEGRERTRKLIAELKLAEGGRVLSRRCYHYLPYDRKPIGRDYYFGDDYTDYREHADVATALARVSKHCTGGRLLDIGCALGVYTKSFLDAGYDAYGVDISEFAVAEAGQSIGAERVRRCDIDSEEVPFPGPFDVLWMADVLEHSAHPDLLLRKVTRLAHQGTWLFLNTSNADSLTHKLLGADWEGFSDYSHHGVTQVSTESLKRWLEELGWELVEWHCGNLWIEGVDPALLRLREVFKRVPELATWLYERELGDVIQLAARKR